MQLIYFFVFIIILVAKVQAQDVVINEVMTSNSSFVIDDDGEYSDWIEIYNRTNSPIEMDNYYLSDDTANLNKWNFPQITLQPHNFLLVYASGKDRVTGNYLHTNFKLSYEGEPLILFNSNNLNYDSLIIPKLKTNESYGRWPDAQIFGKLSEATPSISNNSSNLKTIVELSHYDNKIYEDDFYLKLNSIDSICYSLDGSNPTINNLLYQDSIYINKQKTYNLSLIPSSINLNPESEFGFKLPNNNMNYSVVLKYRTYRNGTYTSDIKSHTFLISRMDYNIPIVSIITDSLNLFQVDTGIYHPGTHYDSNNPDWSGNYFQRGIDWERQACFMFYNSKGKLIMNEPMGVRISGNATRKYPQKSFRLYFRGDYGRSKVSNHFFANRNYKDIKRLTLRTSYAYWFGRNTLYQDELIAQIVEGANLGLETQEYQPVVVYINGEYWGIQNIRERQDKYYLKELKKVNKDSLDIIAGNLTAIEGSANSYENLLNFALNNDMSNEPNYEFIKTQLDVENYINYFIIETYFGNVDWPGNNFKAWRDKNGENKWRFLLYDLDATMGDFQWDPFVHITQEGSNQAELFLSLLHNKDFKNHFINNYKKFLEFMLDQQRIENIQLNIKAHFNEEIQNHSYRWGNPISVDEWEDNCHYFLDFVENRNCAMVDFLEGFLDTTIYFACSPLLRNKVVHLYPNPTSKFINIIVDNYYKINGTVTIYNQVGQEVKRVRIGNNFINLDLSDMDIGVYCVQILSEELNVTKKIIIKK